MADVITLLVVEDSFIIAMDLESLLVSAGFMVVLAGSAAEAMTRIEAEPSGFRALITDVDLGPGPRGWDVAWAFRRHQPLAPVLYVSGTSTGSWTTQGVSGSLIVGKPFTGVQILSALGTLIEASPRQAPPPER